jgi:3-oxoacyl-[acyl-carrier-protein] synthase II
MTAVDDDRRVVVTGLGLVTPLGVGTEESWRAALAGRSGVRAISAFDASALPTRIAAEVRDFDDSRFMESKQVRRNDRFIRFALAAAKLAFDDAGLDVDGIARLDRDRVGVIVGSGMGGVATIEDTVLTMNERGHKKVSPFFVPSVIINLAAGQISLEYGLRGPSFAPVSACATGNHALGEAMLMIERGMCDVVVAGGTEATITPVGLAGFVAARAMSERNDEPDKASRPFDRNRDGFVAGEGAGVLVLESYAHARARGAKMLAWLAGYGASSDAHHITSPPPDGEGARRAMKSAIAMAGLAPRDITHVNAHATSTPAGDVAEARALCALFGSGIDRVAVTATKSMTGHMFGAAGAVEAAFSVLALSRGVLPPTINLDELDPECGPIDVVTSAREARIDAVLSNGFGFGGTNASVVFRRM